MPPIVPVITPIKLASTGDAPAIRDTNVPAIPNVASPAASATKKNFGGMIINLAAMKIITALAKEAMKNI